MKGPEKFIFVGVSLGDCKAFHLSSEGKFTEITEGNRRNVSDASDPGGRIGSYKDDGSPDLRNLSSYFYPCSTNDTIIFMTDGVYDNLGNVAYNYVVKV